MKQLLMTLLWLTSMTVSAQHINHDFHDVSLSDAMKYIQSQTTNYDIIFIYDELEDFRVTTDVRHKSVVNAIMQIVGFYPIRVYQNGESEIYVECTHKTDRHLTGSIIDEKGLPVAYANVAVLNPADSTLLSSGVSNESGYFVVPYEQESALVRISYVGYKTIYHFCNTPDVGTIRMLPEAQRLKGVTVKGQTPVLRREAETIIFDTRHIVGAVNASDLLRFTPGVQLADDDITLFGTHGVLFCINGKEQYMGQKEVLQMLKSYPAKDVERIEITQTPDAKYSASGNAGVINLILRKKDNDYVGGSFSYVHTQYEEHGDEANANVIYNKGNLSTSLNLSGTWDNTRYLETNNICFTDISRRGADNGQIRKDNYSLRWQMDYSASEKLNFGTYIMYADGERSLDIDGSYDFHPNVINSINSIATMTGRQEQTKTWAANFSVVQKTGSKGAKIDYNLDYYRMRMGDARHSVSNGFLNGKSLNDIQQSDTTDFDYRNRITQTVDNYSAKVDVDVAGFRFGTQYVYTHSHRDLDYSGVGEYNHVSNTYDERLWASYLEYVRMFGSGWSAGVGGRYEHVWTNATNWPIVDENKTDYGRLFPTFKMGYTPNQTHSFNWSLSSRITRPNIISLNPNWVWGDVNHVSFGNQYLRPSYLYKVMMGYSFKDVLSFDLYYTYELDRIDAICLVEKQVTYSSWDNITNAHNIGMNAFCCFDKLHWMTATLTQGIWYSKTIRPERKTFQGITRQFTYSKVENISYRGMLQATFFFDSCRKWISNLSLTYSAPEKDVAKSLDARYMVDAGLQYRFCKDHLTVGLVCRNLIASRIKGTEYLSTTNMDFNNKYNYRQLHLTLTYNWGGRVRHNMRHYESDEIQERIVNDF